MVCVKKALALKNYGQCVIMTLHYQVTLICFECSDFMTDSMPKICGLIAGGGSLPIEFVKHAPRMGITRIVAVGFKDYTSPEIAAHTDIYQEIGIGQLGKLIKIFRNNGVNTAIMLGALAPRLTIANVRLDLRMVKLAARVRDRRADSVLGAIAEEMAKDDIILADTTRFLPHICAEHGVMTKKAPSKKEWDDIYFGAFLALESGRLDIGQTVVVRNHAVVAVEAMEGTDACIKRAGSLIDKTVVVKMAKPAQDVRFDVPCFGPQTLKIMREAEARVIAVEAGRTFLLDKEITLHYADENGITIVGISRDEIKEKYNEE